MISALYVVTKDGRPLYYSNLGVDQKFGEGITEAALFSGIISAIQSVMTEIDVGQVSNFNTDKSTIYIRSQDLIAYVLVVDKSAPYDEKQIDNLFDTFHENLPIQQQGANISMTRQENMMIDTIVKMLYENWLKEVAESKASKKMKDELW